ncbi:TPR repeat, SEL1 subfamily [Myxococcus hansupus]|uniref:TPR repeat, SEL1 subfamily n=1 Tax=Pseudomyxococcus hansupus TaxID=1297742 RepID=A0A0H4WPY3_9BACT|nr:TPR repeat, SEL1 subfamily [Myxococcus hansupus]
MAVEAMERAWNLETVPESSREAMAHAYLMAARAGRMEAMTNVALHLEHGDGIRQDVPEAMRWMRKAAGLGDDVAAFNLALCYEKGKGPSGRPNLRLAERWYRRSLALGFPPARANLATVLAKSPRGARMKEAIALFLADVRRGDLKNLRYVAECFELGRGVRKNLKRAIQLYKQAAEAGDAGAQCVLGWMCLGGVGGPVDLLGAFKWYQLSAKQGDASALYSLGGMYLDGEGAPKSKARAIQCFKKAAEQGHAKSMASLKALGVEV